MLVTLRTIGFGTPAFRRLSIRLLIVFLIVVISTTIIAIRHNKQQLLQSLQGSMQTILNSTSEGLKIWIMNQKSYMHQLGENKTLVHLVSELKRVPSQPETLQNSSELLAVREFFRAQADNFGTTGFFIINKQSVSIGSMRDVNLGTLNLISLQRNDLMRRVFAGETVFVPPIRSDIHLHQSQSTQHLPPTMFVVAPVRDATGEVIAAVSRRLDPKANFSRMLEMGRFGWSGETYAFDKRGELLSESRFVLQLQERGLLPRNELSILNIVLKDPGFNVIERNEALPSLVEKPLTHMADRAIKGQAGANMQGYRDYRGIEVFGVWKWDHDLEMGLATEVDVSEALDAYDALCITVLGILSLVLLSSVGGLGFTLVYGERAHKMLKKSRDELELKVKERTIELHHSREHLQSILDISPAFIYSKDIQGRYLCINKTWEKELGLKPQDVIGKTDLELFPGDVANSFGTSDKRVILQRKSMQMEEFLRLKDGIHTFITYKSPLFNQYGEVYGLTGFSHDITDVKLITEALARAKQQADAANQAKSNFLSNISHEIRTPMNAIIGFSDILLHSDMEAVQKRYLSTINRNAKSLLALLSDVIDVAKFEQGKMEFEKVPFILKHLIDDISASLINKAKENGLSFKLFYDDVVPVWVLGDPTRLRQVLVSLIGNAIKFTDSGGVSLKVLAQDNQYWHFIIEDTGIGIAPAHLEHIFSNFAQVDVSSTRKYSGTGLGTAISRQIVEALGGKIWVDSTVGEGSTFHFTMHLPAAEQIDGPGSAAINYPDISLKASQPLNILLAEDIPENAKLGQARLQAMGHQVCLAKNGEQALRYFQQGNFDLILMDIQMPDMDGLEATRKIRELEQPNNQHIPIIGLSGSIVLEDRFRCSDVGMDGFVGKPLDFNELFEEIERLSVLQSTAENEAIQLPPHPFYVELEQLEGIDAQLGLKTWQDVDRYKASLLNFAINHHQDAELIHEALARGNKEAAIQISHTLKGLAGNLALSHVAEFAHRLHKNLSQQSGDYQEALHDLWGFLDIAVNSINQLQLPKPKASPASELKSADDELKLDLLNQLKQALDSDDPDTIEPLIMQLLEYFEQDKLLDIFQCVEGFDFRGAEEAVQDLIEELNKGGLSQAD